MDFSDWVSVAALAVSGLALWLSYRKGAIEKSVSTENAPSPTLSRFNEYFHINLTYRSANIGQEKIWQIRAVRVAAGRGRITVYEYDSGKDGVLSAKLMNSLAEKLHEKLNGHEIATRRKFTGLRNQAGLYFSVIGDVQAIKVTVADEADARRCRTFFKYLPK